MNTWSFRLRRCLAWVLGPLRRHLIRHVPIGDPWEQVTSRFVTPRIFGPGSFRMFRWYFEGHTTVQVENVDDVCRWLSECEYWSDDELFNETDFWQHPRTFENLRKGDCEDHALWAWRKLVELGHEAELFVGQWLRSDGKEHDCHAWVVFQQSGERFVLEAVTKDGVAMIRRLGDVRMEYSPHFSVDATFAMRSYAGYLLYLKERERRRRERAA